MSNVVQRLRICAVLFVALLLIAFSQRTMVVQLTTLDAAIAAAIQAVAQAAYALEAERIGCADFPPLRESVEDLRQSADRFLIFQQAGGIAGALSFDATAAPVVITRLVVDPAHLRQGIATSLLTALERLLPEAAFSVSTAQANAPALALYRRWGFVTDSFHGSPEGIPLIRLSRPMQAERNARSIQT